MSAINDLKHDMWRLIVWVAVGSYLFGYVLGSVVTYFALK